MRMDSPFQDLAHRLRISYGSIYNLFHNTLSILHKRTKRLIFWPSKETNVNTMPAIFFEQYGESVRVIIDCFEIPITQTLNRKGRNQMYSNYKNSTTAKFLIGVSPCGMIIFLSEGYGGRCSDKFITEDSGFLSHLKQGDLILCDKGFQISECVQTQGATLLRPAFKDGQVSQFSALDIESSRRVSNLRIHVERVIGVIKNKYRILTHRVPTKFLLLDNDNDCALNKIVRLSACMINLCPSIVHDE